MTLRLPDLDDRTFTQLVDEARRRIEATCPTWTDMTPHDPGMTLIEVFAHLTEVMLYRLNRLPDKAYVAFLNLLGVQRLAPVAASAVLEFRRDREGDDPVTIPGGTRVTVAGGAKDGPVFATSDAVTLAGGEQSVTVSAHHRDAVDGEVVGQGNGAGGQTFTVAKPPLVRTPEAFDLLVGVAALPGELEEGAPAREWQGTTYRLWEPVWSFAGQAPGAHVYVVDRAEGRVTFAPAVDPGPPPGEPVAGAPPLPAPLVAVPELGRDIAVWYRIGGGPDGQRGRGHARDPGRQRGRREGHEPRARPGRPGHRAGRQRRAAGPERVPDRAPGRHGRGLRAAGRPEHRRRGPGPGADPGRPVVLRPRPGEVEVVLVPHVPEDAAPGGRVDAATLVAHQTEEARLATQRELDERKSLGLPPVVVGWAPVKAASVHARVVVRREEDEARVRDRILDRLHSALSPLPSDGREGWRFGQALRRSNVYRLLEQAEPGVQWVDRMSFLVDEAPDGDVPAVAADRYQDRSWYAGSGEVLFRSTNDGDGWEPVGRFPGERVRVVTPYPAPLRPGITPRPGLVAVAARALDGPQSSVYVSEDLGATWRRVSGLDVGITDLAWTSRGSQPELLIASDKGLHEVTLLEGEGVAAPVQVAVDPTDPDRGFYGVETFVDERGEWGVAVASQAEQGVYLSTQAGEPGSFANVGLQGEDTRTLAVQVDGAATWLWAGLGEANPDVAGKGAARARLFESDVRWEMRTDGWVGSTCWSLAFAGDQAVAASQNGGVLRLDTAATTAAWQPLDVNAGLPLRDRARFDPVVVVAAPPAGRPVMAGGPKGVHRSRKPTTKDPRTWEPCDHREAAEVVTIPPTWVLCSGQHRIEVVTRAAAGRGPTQPDDADEGDGGAGDAP